MKDKCKWFKFILVVHLFWILHPRTDKAGQNDYIFMLIAYITVLHISAGHAMFAYVPHFLFWGPLSKYKYFDISMWYCELWPHMFRITSSRCLTPPRIFSLNHTCDGWLQKSLWSIDHGKKHLLKFQTEVNIFYLSRVAWRHSGFFSRAEIFNLECFVQKYLYHGVLCKNIGQVSLRVTRPSWLTIWIWPVPLINFRKAKQWIIWNRADLASFLFN